MTLNIVMYVYILSSTRMVVRGCYVTSCTCTPCRQVKETKRVEMAAAEGRGKSEAEKAGLEAAIAAGQQREAALQQTITAIEQEARDYKVRPQLVVLHSKRHAAWLAVYSWCYVNAGMLRLECLNRPHMLLSRCWQPLQANPPCPAADCLFA